MLPFIALSLFAEDFAGKNSMNGISFKNYKNFNKKWKLVVVRYRKDTEELRFTYANPLAYKTLLANSVHFPEGSAFGKIGVKTNPDPLFESSVVPSGARRYQLMIKNNKFKNEHGWGYGLFDENGKTFPGNPQEQVQACSACHEAAESRGFVFSQLMDNLDLKKNHGITKLNFKLIERESLPKNIQELIPPVFKFLKLLDEKMAKYAFEGTLEEVRPFLSLEVLKSKMPALLLNERKDMYSIVVPENLGSRCQDGLKNGIYMKSIYSQLNSKNENKTLHYCYTY